MNTIITCAKRQWSNNKKCNVPIELLIKITTYLNNDELYELYMNWVVYGTVFRNALILNTLYIPAKLRSVSHDHSIAKTMLDKYCHTNYLYLKDIINIIDNSKINILMRSPYIIHIDNSHIAFYIFYMYHHQFKRIIEGASIVNFNSSKLMDNNYLNKSMKIKSKLDYTYNYGDKIDAGDILPTIKIEDVHNTIITDLPKCSMVYIINCSYIYMNVDAKHCLIRCANNICIMNYSECWEYVEVNSSNNVDIMDEIDKLHCENSDHSYFGGIYKLYAENVSNICIESVAEDRFNEDMGIYVAVEEDIDEYLISI